MKFRNKIQSQITVSRRIPSFELFIVTELRDPNCSFGIEKVGLLEAPLLRKFWKWRICGGKYNFGVIRVSASLSLLEIKSKERDRAWQLSSVLYYFVHLVDNFWPTFPFSQIPLVFLTEGVSPLQLLISGNRFTFLTSHSEMTQPSSCIRTSSFNFWQYCFLFKVLCDNYISYLVNMFEGVHKNFIDY